MAGVNKVILVGRLGADPEVRNLPSGASVVNFNMATSESWTNKNGEKVEQTEWHRIELWDALAKTAEQYLKKGDMVYIEGKLRTEKWTDQQGQERSTIRIRGLAMQLLGGRGANQSFDEGGNAQASAPSYQQSAPAAPRQNTPSAVATPMSEPFVGGSDDDLPF